MKKQKQSIRLLFFVMNLCQFDNRLYQKHPILLLIESCMVFLGSNRYVFLVYYGVLKYLCSQIK